MTPEFRARLESLMIDWYAAEDAGEMTLTELLSAVREIAKEQKPVAVGTAPSMIGPGFLGGMVGGLAAAMLLQRPTVADEEKPAP